MSIVVVHKSNASRRQHLVRAAEYAAEAGERLLVVVADPTWEPEIADVVVPVDPLDIGATVAAVRELAVSEAEPIRAVAAFVAHSVPAAAAVAAELGLPFVAEQVTRTLRDKYAMREALGAGGVPQPMYRLARSLDEAWAHATRIGFPLVLKPLFDNDTGYLRRFDDGDELAEHFAVVQRGAWIGVEHNPHHAWAVEKYGNALMIEQYLTGAEVSVESIVAGGETHVVAIHDKPLAQAGPYFVDRHYATPSALPVDVQRRVVELTVAAHRAVGIETGASHTEFRIQDDGTPVILETAARIGGGPVYQSVLLSTGIDMVAAVLDIARGAAPDLEPRAQPTPTGFNLFFAEQAGRIMAFHGVDEAHRRTDVHDLQLYRGVGDDVDIPPRAWQSHGHVVFTAESRGRLDRISRDLFTSLDIEIFQPS